MNESVVLFRLSAAEIESLQERLKPAGCLVWAEAELIEAGLLCSLP